MSRSPATLQPQARSGVTGQFSLSPSSIPPLPIAVCLLLVLAFALFFGALAVQQHRTFQTNGLDLGNVDQALWNTAQGRFLHFTLMTPIQSRLALHVEPILWLFVPLYWLNIGGPKMLLVVQAAIVALGAWPLYQLAIIRNPWLKAKDALAPWHYFLSLIFPLAYLLLPALESAVLFDFHAVTLSATFLLFGFLALEQKKVGQFFIFAVLTMACKEDMPLVVALLGLYAGLAQRRWRLAGLTITLSLLWFGVAFFLVQPRFAAGGNVQLERYAWLGETPPAMLQTLLTRPALVFNHLWYQADLPGYLTRLFFPTAFLALFSPLTLLPMLPNLAINLLSSNPFTWRLEDFHYGAPLAPFLFISTIYGLRQMSLWLTRLPRPFSAFMPAVLLLCLLLCSLLYHHYRGFTPLARPFAWPEITTHQRQLTDFLASLPADTPMFAQSNLAPHLTHRPVIYTDFAYFTDPHFPAAVKAEEIVLDITTLENRGGLHQFLRQTLFQSGDYQLVSAQDGILQLQPTAHQPPPAIPLGFTHHVPFIVSSPPRYPLTIDFSDVIRLRGYTLYFNRQEEVQVSIDLEPLQPLVELPNLQPVLYLLDGEGQPLGATIDLPPALVWFPLPEWPVGQTVRVHFNTLPWYTRDTAFYRLALGLVDGGDPWDVSRRFRPQLSQPTPFAVRFPADGTLVELAQIRHIWGMPEGGPTVRQFTLPQPPHPLPANFDDQLKLLGYSKPIIQTSSPAEDNTLTLTLYWQAATAPKSLTRFVHVIGGDGQLYSQNDSAPDRGQYPTHLWQPGEVVVETVTLPFPPELQADDYTLHVGLYRPDTGNRLPLQTGGDHIEISP